MSEISHLATDKDIVTMGTAIIGAICLVIGGAIGFFTKYFYENKKINESKKALRQQMITNNIAPMRQAWINDLRTTSSELIAKIIDYYRMNRKIRVQGIHDDWSKEIVINTPSKVISLFSYLRLLLPISSEGAIDKEISSEIIESLNILHELSAGEVNEKEFYSKITEIENKINTLLKKEWEVTKSLKEID